MEVNIPLFMIGYRDILENEDNVNETNCYRNNIK